MADSAGAFYLALSQSLESVNAVASYVNLHYAVQRLMDKLESNPSDSTTKSQAFTALGLLERKKTALGPVANCRNPYEEFLRQAKATNNPSYAHYVQALTIFGELSPTWQSELKPPGPPLSFSTTPAASQPVPDPRLSRSLNTGSRGPAPSLNGEQMQLLERAKLQIADAVQEFEFKKVYEGKGRLEDALRMLNQIG